MNDISLYEKIPAEEKNFPIRLFRQQRGAGGMRAHWHEHIEILFFTSGGCRMTCGTNSFDVKVNDLVFVNSNEIHFSEKSVSSKYWCMLINPAFFLDVNFENILIKNVIKDDEYICEYFQKILKENEERGEGYDMAIKGYTYGLMTYILRNYKKSRKEVGRFFETEAKIKRLDRVFKYIAEHYTEKITTATLAEISYLSEYYFCRFFKAATGQSAVNYINRMRIEKAAVLLENTSESITDVAMHVGFEDMNYFSRTFKHFMNISPRQYRKILK